MENIPQIDPQIKGCDETDFISFTNEAVQSLKSDFEKNKVPDGYFLRIKTILGETAGMTFKLEYDYNFEAEKDTEFMLSELPIVIDNISLFYLLGSKIDYIDGENPGFLVKAYRDY